MRFNAIPFHYPHPPRPLPASLSFAARRHGRRLTGCSVSLTRDDEPIRIENDRLGENTHFPVPRSRHVVFLNYRRFLSKNTLECESARGLLPFRVIITRVAARGGTPPSDSRCVFPGRTRRPERRAVWPRE